jgi:hypothetical protein
MHIFLSSLPAWSIRFSADENGYEKMRIDIEDVICRMQDQLKYFFCFCFNLSYAVILYLRSVRLATCAGYVREDAGHGC